MCQSHPEQTELTQEYLDSLAALAHSTVPNEQELRASTLPHGWQVEEGQTPAPYRAELYRDETGGGIAQEPSGEGTRRRSTKGDDGRSRLRPSLCHMPSSITTPIWICSMAK